MTPETALIQFHAWAQEERAGQQRLLAALERVESAVRQASDEELATGCAEMATAFEDAEARASRREALCTVLGAHFGVAARTLSVSSILERAGRERLGPESVRRALASLRDELRDVVRSVNRVARRLSAVAQHQRGLLADLLAIFGRRPAGAGDERGGGQLVDAEA